MLSEIDDEGVPEIIFHHPLGDGRAIMDLIRKIGYARFAVTATLIGAAAYVAPSIWATDRMLFGLVSFDQLTFILSLALAYAALGVDDGALRTRLALGVIAAFALATVLP